MSRLFHLQRLSQHEPWRRNPHAPALAAISLLLALNGCIGPVNPSFPLTVDQARSALAKMKDHPKPLTRPLLVLGGWIDPGFATKKLIKQFHNYTNDERIIGVSFGSCKTFDDCRDKAIAELDHQFPSTDLQWTTQVDVIAFSMGGLVARYAHQQQPLGIVHRRLRIARLFTISVPHRGAAMASMPPLNKLQVDMRPDSAFMNAINQGQKNSDYPIYPYVRLGDRVVGEANTAPPGQTAWWVSNLPLQAAHISAHNDLRIHADIVRRLRGEKTFTTAPPTPIPDN